MVPVPLHPHRLAQRGYNQAGLLGRGLCAHTGWSMASGVLRRSRDAPPQATLGKRQRTDNVRNSFQLKHPHRLTGQHILIVDDVRTTGQTLRACMDALEPARPLSLSSVVLAQAELHGDRL